MPDERGEIASALEPSEESKLKEQIENLQRDLAGERDARKEDRFAFVLGIIILIDIAAFSFMPTFGGPIAILILELILLVFLARRLGIEEIHRLLDRILSHVSRGARDHD